MRHPSRAHWFNHLGSADAARVVCALEAVRQYDWLRITRTDDKRLTLRISAAPHSAEPFVEMSFGAPREDIPSALRTLNRQLIGILTRVARANGARFTVQLATDRLV